MNNITVDGSYFNNSFGLRRPARRPHGRRADLARGDRAGPGERRAVRRAAGQLRRRRRQHRHPQRHELDHAASVYYRYARRRLRRHRGAGPGRSTRARSITKNTGGWAGGPIIKNKLFAFGSYEKQDDTRPLTTFVANPGGAPARGNITRVLASDLNSAQLVPVEASTTTRARTRTSARTTPAKPFLVKARLQPEQHRTRSASATTSSTRAPTCNLSTLVVARQRPRDRHNTTFLNFQNSNYRSSRTSGRASASGTRCSAATWPNSLIVGYTKQDESRGARRRRSSRSSTSSTAAASTYTSFGSEPFTPNNELRYNTFQLQDSFTKLQQRSTR